MNAKRVRTALIGVVVLGSVVAASAPSSGATATGTGTAYSAGGQAGTVGSITPTVKVCVTILPCSSGLLGAVSGLLGGLLTAVTGIVSDVTAIPSGVVNAVIASGLSASQPATQLSRPSPEYDSASTPNLPTCGAQGWDASGAGDCYAGTAAVVPATSALGLNVTAVGGYATDDASGYVGAAKATGVSLGVLGISLGTLGAVWAHAQCTSCGAATPTYEAKYGTVNATFLPTAARPAGALTTTLGNGTTAATLNGVALTSTNATSVNVGGLVITPTLNGNLLTLSIALTTAQLKTLVPTLNGLSNILSTSATLKIAIGPGSKTTTAGGATASGLTISADLSLDIKIGVLGLLTAEVTAGGGANPDLLNVSLAYASATAGTPAASWVAPGQI